MAGIDLPHDGARWHDVVMPAGCWHPHAREAVVAGCIVFFLFEQLRSRRCRNRDFEYEVKIL